jgi:hypothetical protein
MPLFCRHNARIDGKEVRTPKYSVQFVHINIMDFLVKKKDATSQVFSSNSCGTGAYLPPPVTTATFPARASWRKGEDNAVDAMIYYSVHNGATLLGVASRCGYDEII